MLFSLAMLLAVVVATGAASGATAAPTVQMLTGPGPQSLDPGLDYTTQGSEIGLADDIPVSPPTEHVGGPAGTRAEARPHHSASGDLATAARPTR